MYRPAFLILVATCLGACSLTDSDSTAKLSLDQMAIPTQPQLARALSVSSDQSATVTLPSEAGQIQKVSRHPLANGIEQLIDYDHVVPGSKGNQVKVDILTPTTNARLESASEPSIGEKPTETGIQKELSDNFPRMQMRIVSSPRSNDYGVYGLAIGQWANGVRCIYAWQWIEPLKADASNGEKQLASLRVRLCRSDMTLDQLAALVDHVKIDPARETTGTQASAADVRTLETQSAKPIPKAATEKVVAKRTAARAAVSHIAAVTRTETLSLRASLPATSPTSDLDPTLPAAAFRGPTGASATYQH